MEEAERVEGQATATAAPGGQRTTEVVGDGACRGGVEAVDRDMDRRRMAVGDHGRGERRHDLGTAGCLIGFKRRVDPGRLRMKFAVATGRSSIACERRTIC